MKLKTFLKPLDPSIQITVQQENNGYVYAGDKTVCGGTEKNEAFCKELLEQKVKSYTIIDGKMAVVVRKTTHWYFSLEKYKKDMGFTTENSRKFDGLKVPYFMSDGTKEKVWYFHNGFGIHKDWCEKR